MSEYATGSVASAIVPPNGEVLIRPVILSGSARLQSVGNVAIGFADRITRPKMLDESGVAFVDMNSSGSLLLEANQEGVIATTSLSGCTGVAGFAKYEDGSTAQFISHYDTISQTSHFTKEDSPINAQLFRFRHDTEKGEGLTGIIDFVIGYDASTHHNPMYGNRQDVFANWSYLDQIQSSASQLGKNARVIFLPYQWGSGHTLAAGKTEGQNGIFWNGVRVDFDAYFANNTIR